MEFTKKESFAIQITNYLKDKEFPKACKLAEEMVKKFPKEALSHFMAAKCHYFSGDYKKAKTEGQKAFNLSHTKYDMLVSAIVTASAYYMLKEYQKGYKMLSLFEKEKHAELKKLLLLFSIVLKDKKKAARYYNQLYDLNHAVARKVIRDLASGH